MTIEEILSSYPEKSQKIAAALTNAGLHCVGCNAATWETLEAGVYGHGKSEEELKRLLSELEAIIAEKIDTTTIAFTERAAKKFSAILKQENKEGWALRFGDKPGGCGGYEYVLDYSEKPAEDDEVLISYGVAIHVKKAQLKRLLGSLIDFEDGLNGSGFKISNPNVKSSCSCGSSQSY